MFDFADANLVKMKWSNDECELSEIIERTKHLLSPEVEQMNLTPFLTFLAIKPKCLSKNVWN